MPTDEEVKAAVTKVLNTRGAAATEEELGTLVQLVKGQLRLAIGDLPLDQLAPKLTDLFLQGRRNMPPDAHRPQLRQLVASDCHKFGAPVPSAAATEVLVNVAIGWMIDHSLPTPPGGRPVLMHNVVGLYFAGA